ncbi:hypothetical protein [Cognatiluteimonas telluris]|jgi:hypothetical protein|uniref:hypothetical protein n=1 Tax=Cognatiluteimonas telluris TaxID=1104775 RepID=UPI00140C431A|nr:hypothetical protein [Lysobacter telluris]
MSLDDSRGDDPLRRNPADDRPTKRTHPLFWLLILLALFALGWAFYNHYAGHTAPMPLPVPPAAASPRS